MMEQSDLTIIAPCYNEAAVVDQFFAELMRALDQVNVIWRVYFIDDGSTDATLERLNALARSDRRVRVYSLSRNFGHQIALSAGLDVSLGSAVVLMDADLQHPPSIIPQMKVTPGGGAHAHHLVTRVEEGEVDGEVGGGAGVRLDIGVVDAEQRLGAMASVSTGSMNCWPS